MILEVHATDSTSSHDVKARVKETFVQAGMPLTEVTHDSLTKRLSVTQTEIKRLQAEVASLRLTLGGRTFSADVPEPVGCPAPGACVQVAEIKRLRAQVERLGGSWQEE
jgi:uncharacterized small protein (DUF1192 family)